MILKLTRLQALRMSGGATQMAATGAKTNPTFVPNTEMQGEMPLDND